MTEPIEQLSARVAELMGWKRSWVDGDGNTRNPLHHPSEVFRLMCEFNVWPVVDTEYGEWFVVILSRDLRSDINVDIDDMQDTESRQQAATRAVLLAVEQILKEKSDV